MKNTYVAIMAGGIGSRFWPKSRYQFPKQFLDILGVGKTLLQSTYDRFLKICPQENIYILTNENYRPIVQEQLSGINNANILGEPMRKNTAPCVAYFSHKIYATDPDANMIVSPADHLVMHEDKFVDVMKKAIEFADSHDALITLGIRPTKPNTGYGYIQYIEESEQNGMYKVKTFTEKPSLKIAKTFIKSGDFLWNSGIFIWNLKTIQEAFKQNLPEIYDIFGDGKKFYNTENEPAFVNKAFSMCSNISIDYGIMEKADNVYVMPANFGWSDLGTWASLYENYEKDYLSNAVSGKNVIIHDAADCMVMAPDNKLVILQGLKDFIIVDTEDVLLIFHKSQEQEIKQIVSEVKRSKGDKYL